MSTRASENGIYSTGHATSKGNLPDAQIWKRRDDSFRLYVGSEEKRIHSSDAEKRAGHACRNIARKVRPKSGERKSIRWKG